MRTLLKASMDIEAGNKAILDGSLQKIIQSTTERLKPEFSFFYPENGKRTCCMIFDMKDSSEIPSIAEPFFMVLNAEVNFTPVMNAQDLQKGLESLKKS